MNSGKEKKKEGRVKKKITLKFFLQVAIKIGLLHLGLLIEPVPNNTSTLPRPTLHMNEHICNIHT